MLERRNTKWKIKRYHSLTVKTAITVKDKNFTLEVIAYRMLTEEEGRKMLDVWLKDNQLNDFPEGVTAQMISLHGVDDPRTVS